jgi:membrane-bound lytic murein transglycosylase A
VDPSQHGFGELLWIDGESPVLSGAVPSYRRLVTALDAGGAVKGVVRVDLYLGRGEAAGAEAGRIRHPLKMWRLVPKSQ